MRFINVSLRSDISGLSRYKSEDRHKYENEDRAHKYDERSAHNTENIFRRRGFISLTIADIAKGVFNSQLLPFFNFPSNGLSGLASENDASADFFAW